MRPLIRRSMSGATVTTPLVITGPASAVPSTTSSANNRSVKLSRWNEHYLIPTANPTANPPDTTPITSFTAPDWVFVTKTGPAGVLTTPNTNVIGRYAYAVFNEGGLLDINVAGYPSTLPSESPHPTLSPSPSPTPAVLPDVGYARKGSLAFADLTQLPKG